MISLAPFLSSVLRVTRLPAPKALLTSRGYQGFGIHFYLEIFELDSIHFPKPFICLYMEIDRSIIEKIKTYGICFV